ncbi:MAG: hypothetical protein KC561_16835, partial [Myxococcales bacterium]|nr:hypothetical protein [Myxococcales bacterium]
MAFTGLVAYSRRHGQRHRLPVLFWVLLLTAVWATVQSLPLGGVFRFLMGSATELWSVSGHEPARIAGNLVESTHAGARYGLAALLFGAGFYFFQTTDRIDRLIGLVVGSGVLCVGIAFVSGWLDPNHVLFFYEPNMGPVRPGWRGPFVNPDLFGAYVAVGAVLALGRGLSLRAQQVRFAHYSMFVVLMVGVICSYSLSAFIAGAIGTLAVLLNLFRHTHRPAGLLETVLLLVVAAGSIVGAMIVFGMAPSPGSALREQLASLAELPSIWSRVLGVAFANPLFGVGAGAQSDLLMLQGEGTTSIWFARNQILQWCVDFGLPMAGLLCTATWFAVRRVFQRWHTEDIPTMIPIGGAIAALLVVGALDFSIETTSFGVMAVLLVSALNGRAYRYGSRTSRFKVLAALHRAPKRVAFGAALAVALFAATWSTILWAGDAMARERVGTVSDRGELIESADRLLAHRPGDGALYRAVGRRLVELGDLQGGAEWLTKAQNRLPADWRTSQWLGLTYVRLGQDELGAQHLRTAWGQLRDFEEAEAAEPNSSSSDEVISEQQVSFL